MNIERRISECQSELASLKQALYSSDPSDTERRLRISEQIDEMEEIIKDLEEEKRKSRND